MFWVKRLFSAGRAVAAGAAAVLCTSFSLNASTDPAPLLRGRQLRRVLPHVVTGVCIMLLGMGLLYSSFTAWGGA
jgi:xanthine/uracil permease